MLIRLAPVFLAVATAAAQAATDASVPDAAASAASSPASSAATGQAAVPGLQIDWDCGACKPNDKVPPLIESGYAKAAAAGHVGLADGDKVLVKITAFHQRNPALRTMFGFMAGKDELTVSLSWHGKQVTVDDYAANALQGMNAIAESVGKKSFAAARKLVADERAGSAAAGQ